MVAKMTDLTVTRLLPDADATSALARQLAPTLSAGDVLLLAGQIGAGKTHFARALIQHLLTKSGLAEDVPSPTFTLVQTYQAGPLSLWHADLYRLTHPDEILELGLDDAMAESVCLIEWPDRMGHLLPKQALHLQFTATDQDQRLLMATGAQPRWSAQLSLIAGPHHG